MVVLLPSFAYTQATDSVWCFGDGAKINFKNGISIDSSSVNTRGSCVSICDSIGNLLFYFSGTPLALFGQYPKSAMVYNKLDMTLLDGDSMVGDAWYKEYVIVNNPMHNNQFIVFCAGVTTSEGLYYSLVDMTQDSGRGAVVQKNVQLLDSTYWVADGLTAIKHGNGRDWWVICRHWELPANNEFMYYLVTPDSIYLHHTQNIGDVVQSSLYRIETSHDGSKVACVTNKGLMSVYDFDRCNGSLYNEFYLEHETTNFNLFPFYWDCEFSPNKRYLYVSQAYSPYDTASYLLRFDLQAANIAASRDTLFATEFSAIGGLIELAPDGKIYWSCAYNPPNTWYYPYPDSAHNYINENLSVINYPDSSFCNFQPFSFYLGGKRTYYGLPNNPNYELGPLQGSPCDTLSANLAPNTPNPLQGGLNTTYISAWEKLFVNASGLKGKQLTATIYDATGKEKLARGKPPGGGLGVFGGHFTLDVDCAGWPSGLYVVHLQTEKEVLSKKFVKE